MSILINYMFSIVVKMIKLYRVTINRLFSNEDTMKTLDYLDAIKTKFELKSDYALAKKMGITQTAINRMRHGKVVLGDETALKIAELLEINASEILIQSHMERCRNSAVKAAWEAIGKELKGRHFAVSTMQNETSTSPIGGALNGFRGDTNHYYVK